MPTITRANKADFPEILRLQYAAYQSEAEIYDDYTIQPLTQTLGYEIFKEEEVNDRLILVYFRKEL